MNQHETKEEMKQDQSIIIITKHDKLRDIVMSVPFDVVQFRFIHCWDPRDRT